MLEIQRVRNFTLYESPIIKWLFFFVAALMIIIPVGIFFYPPIILAWKYLPGYFVVAYLIAGFSNNSFAVTAHGFYVINPNYPFKKFRHSPNFKIKNIRIDQTGTFWWLFFPMGQFGGNCNYVEITTIEGQRHKFLCAGLDLDAFDENDTEETLDTLHDNLKRKNIPVQFNFS
ncbi:hypothetical protein [Flavilitoribacter nigricans]|nr:hypothetical protein [Flavilitoribacter nigricans]